MASKQITRRQPAKSWMGGKAHHLLEHINQQQWEQIITTRKQMKNPMFTVGFLSPVETNSQSLPIITFQVRMLIGSKASFVMWKHQIRIRARKQHPAYNKNNVGIHETYKHRRIFLSFEYFGSSLGRPYSLTLQWCHKHNKLTYTIRNNILFSETVPPHCHCNAVPLCHYHDSSFT